MHACVCTPRSGISTQPLHSGLNLPMLQPLTYPDVTRLFIPLPIPCAAMGECGQSVSKIKWHDVE